MKYRVVKTVTESIEKETPFCRKNGNNAFVKALADDKTVEIRFYDNISPGIYCRYTADSCSKLLSEYQEDCTIEEFNEALLRYISELHRYLEIDIKRAKEYLPNE